MKNEENKENANKKNTRIYWIIGIIIEVIIILVIIYFKFLNNPYDKIIECTLKNQTNNGYTTEIKDVFYLKDNITIKEKKIINYSFQYESSYLEFTDKLKEATMESSVDGYSVKIKSNDDIYVDQAIYEYDIEKIKKGNGVDIAGNTVTFKISDEETYTLAQLSKEEIEIQYAELGYTCK